MGLKAEIAEIAEAQKTQWNAEHSKKQRRLSVSSEEFNSEKMEKKLLGESPYPSAAKESEFDISKDLINQVSSNTSEPEPSEPIHKAISFTSEEVRSAKDASYAQRSQKGNSQISQ